MYDYDRQARTTILPYGQYLQQALVSGRKGGTRRSVHLILRVSTAVGDHLNRSWRVRSGCVAERAGGVAARKGGSTG